MPHKPLSTPPTIPSTKRKASLSLQLTPAHLRMIQELMGLLGYDKQVDIVRHAIVTLYQANQAKIPLHKSL